MRVRIARDELRRIRELTYTIKALEAEIARLVAQIAPQLLTEPGLGPPVRSAEHAGRGSARRSSRIEETFLTGVVRWRELKRRAQGLSVDFPRGPGDDGRVPRLPDCLRTPLPKFGVDASSVSRALAEQDASWTNAADRLAVESLGRDEGGDSIVEGRDVADVR